MVSRALLGPGGTLLPGVGRVAAHQRRAGPRIDHLEYDSAVEGRCDGQPIEQSQLLTRRSGRGELIDVAEGTGISSYPVIGSIGLLAGSAFLTNVLPLGEPGQLVSGGMLPLLNLGVGLAVSAGLVLIVSEFLEQTFAIRTRGG